MQEENIMSLTTTGTGDLRDKIYTIRGYQVMLDRDLAEIYGYTTKAFNQQVSRNIDKFAEDFRFQLSEDEAWDLSRSHFVTTMQTKGMKGGRVYLPYVFTEQGIYMLMTILKGDMATQQSIRLIRLFKSMKDYVMDHPPLSQSLDYLPLLTQISDNTQRISKIENQLEEVVTQTDLSDFIQSFTTEHLGRELMFYKNQIMEAYLVYQDLYSHATQNIYIIDNYISVKTLMMLKDVSPEIKIIIYSRNKGKHLSQSEIESFRQEYPQVNFEIRKTKADVHDRFIIIDYELPSEIIFHSGTSPKDTGNSISGLMECHDKKIYHEMMKEL